MYELTSANVFYPRMVPLHGDFPKTIESEKDLDLNALNKEVTFATGGYFPKNAKILHAPELKEGYFHLKERVCYLASGVQITWTKV